MAASPTAAFNALVNKMTNHERNLWARAGYPGLLHKEIKKLLPYADAAERRLTGKWITLREYREGKR